jgi:hypothetical protein
VRCHPTGAHPFAICSPVSLTRQRCGLAPAIQQELSRGPFRIAGGEPQRNGLHPAPADRSAQLRRKVIRGAVPLSGKPPNDPVGLQRQRDPLCPLSGWADSHFDSQGPGLVRSERTLADQEAYAFAWCGRGRTACRLPLTSGTRVRLPLGSFRLFPVYPIKSSGFCPSTR